MLGFSTDVGVYGNHILEHRAALGDGLSPLLESSPLNVRRRYKDRYGDDDMALVLTGILRPALHRGTAHAESTSLHCNLSKRIYFCNDCLSHKCNLKTPLFLTPRFQKSKQHMFSFGHTQTQLAWYT